MPSTNLMSRLRRSSFGVFVGFLAFSALLAIATVLFGEFGDFEVRVLTTTSIIAVVSIAILCCSAYSARTGNSLPGVVGISLALLAGVLWIFAIWAEINHRTYFEVTGTISVFAVAAAHAMALLVVRLRSTHRWMQLATTSLILLLASLISMMIIGTLDDTDTVMKLLAVLAILVALGTLLIPVLGRWGGESDLPPRETLILEKRSEGIYTDPAGQAYAVRLLQRSEEENGTETDAGE